MDSERENLQIETITEEDCPMTHLKPSHEQLVLEALSSGRYRDIDEFLDEALSAWEKSESERYDLQEAQAAAAGIRELREGVTLGGLKLKTW